LRCIRTIRNPQSAARIHEADIVAIAPKLAHELGYTLHGKRKRPGVVDLRANV